MGDIFHEYPQDPTQPQSNWELKGKGAEKENPLRELGHKEFGNYEPPPKPAKGIPRTLNVDPVYKIKSFAGANYTTKTSAADKSFYSANQLEYEARALGASVNYAEKKGELTLVSAKGKYSMNHGEVDFVDLTSKLLGLNQPPAAPPSPKAGGGPLAARVTDPTAHGAPLAPGSGSPNVLIGNLPAWRALMDFTTCPLVKGVVPDVGGMVLKGSATVLINNMPACRAGDVVMETPGGPNPIVAGCPTVMIGEVPPPPKPPPPPPPPGAKVDLTGTGDVNTVEGEAKALASVDLAKREASAEAKVGGIAAVAKGQIHGALKVRIPFTTHYVGVGGTAEGSLGSIGAEVGLGGYINKADPVTGVKKLFKLDGGGRLAGGVGAGLKFSLEIE